MASVDKGALSSALNQLQGEGLITGWQPRPLGMYLIEILGGHTLRPNAKEAAMWVQGALYTAAVKDMGQAIEQLPDTDEVARILGVLQTDGFIQRWQIDADENYIVLGADDDERFVDAASIEPWIEGALWGWAQHLRQTREVRETLAARLNSLVARGRVTTWSVDDDRYRIVLSGLDQAFSVQGSSNMAAWLHGFGAVDLLGKGS